MFRTVVLAVVAGCGVTAAASAPAPGRLAFDIGLPRAREITLMNPDGTGVRELPQLGNAFDPVWSPQGSALAFVGSRGSATDVYASSGDGSGLVRLTFGPGENLSPAWSPDGERIAYVHVAGAHESLEVMAADGSHVRRVTGNLGHSAGGVVQVAGVLRVGGRRLAGRGVRVFVGGARLSLLTSSSGRFATRVKPRAPGSIRVQFAGTGSLLPATSVAAAVRRCAPTRRR